MLEGFGKQSSKLTLKRAKGGEIFDRKGGKIVGSAIRRNDRHSKVCTAKGPRDRRVRLSAGTAIQFYDVQDRLGCDRPSEAIDWLIKEAKSAIDALEAKNEGKTEEGEVEEQVSGEEPNNCFSFYPPILSSSEFQNFSNEENFENRNQIHGFWSFKSSSELVFDSWQQKVLGQEEQFFSQGGTLQSSFSPTGNHSLCALNYDQMPADSLSPAAGEIFSGDGFSGFCGLLGIRGEKDKQNPCPNKPSSSSSSLLHYQS